MPGTHGDLYREIGALVVAAHDGQAMDLRHTSEQLARCYINLGVPADTIARAIARSMAAVGVSRAMLDHRPGQIDALPETEGDAEELLPEAIGPVARSATVVLPSGVRLAVLS